MTFENQNQTTKLFKSGITEQDMKSEHGHYMKKIFCLLLFNILLTSQQHIAVQDINLLRFNNSVNYAGGSGVSVIINPTGAPEFNNRFISLHKHHLLTIRQQVSFYCA